MTQLVVRFDEGNKVSEDQESAPESAVDAFVAAIRELQGQEEPSIGALTNEQLLGDIRPRMEAGTLPGLFTTDLAEGWCHYARGEISRHLQRATRQLDKVDGRRYVPMLEDLVAGDPPRWGDTEQAVDLHVKHAEHRIERLIGATRRHGTLLVAEGAATVAQGRKRSHLMVDMVWDKIERQSRSWREPEAA